jgi:hypothetical protein
MKEVFCLIFHLLTTLAKLIRPGGSRAVIAENLLLKQQLIIHSRSRQRAPNLTTQDRALLGFWSLFLNPRRIARSAIIIRPSALMRFHNALKKRKYRNLYSPGGGRKPGPKGPSREVITAIVEMKRRNPRYGCPRIAQQINLAFGLEFDKDVIRRILATHYKPDPSDHGPSWLTVIGHVKDSLWSVDLFRCESILLKSHWVMVSWISTPAGLLASLFTPEMWMVQRFVACSITPLPDRAGRNISAQIMILCFNIIGGKPICACLILKKSNQFHMCRCLIHLSND